MRPVTPEEKLRGPSLADIVGQLRQMADLVESGEIEATSAILVLPRADQHWPDVFGWGEALSSVEMIGIMELTKSFFVVNRTERK